MLLGLACLVLHARYSWRMMLFHECHGPSQSHSNIVLRQSPLARNCIEIVKVYTNTFITLCSGLGLSRGTTLRDILSASRSFLLSIIAPLLRR